MEVGDYTVEYAKSGRSTCRISGRKIQKGKLRIGLMKENEYSDYPYPEWYDFENFLQSSDHVEQFQQHIADGHTVGGLNKLKKPDRARVEQLMNSSSIQTTRPKNQPFQQQNFGFQPFQQQNVGFQPFQQQNLGFQFVSRTTQSKSTSEEMEYEIQRSEYLNDKELEEADMLDENNPYNEQDEQRKQQEQMRQQIVEYLKRLQKATEFTKIPDEKAVSMLLQDLSTVELQLILQRMVNANPKLLQQLKPHVIEILEAREKN